MHVPHTIGRNFARGIDWCRIHCGPRLSLQLSLKSRFRLMARPFTLFPCSLQETTKVSRRPSPDTQFRKLHRWVYHSLYLSLVDGRSSDPTAPKNDQPPKISKSPRSDGPVSTCTSDDPPLPKWQTCCRSAPVDPDVTFDAECNGTPPVTNLARLWPQSWSDRRRTVYPSLARFRGLNEIPLQCARDTYHATRFCERNRWV